MMQIFLDMELFETVVLYPEEYPNWYKILGAHSKIFLNISKTDYESEKDSNFILQSFIKMNTGREPTPLKDHFENIVVDESILLKTPRAVYFLDISKEKAKKLEQKYGIIIQGVDCIDDNILRGSYCRTLKENNICELGDKIGWHNLLNIPIPPLNSLVLSDNFLFANEGGKRGTANFLQLMDTILPSELETDFQVLIISKENKDYDKQNCERKVGEIKTSLNNLNRPYSITFELVFSETIHKRIAISNYFIIVVEQGYAVFKSADLKTVHENTDVYLDRAFNRIDLKDGDTVFDNSTFWLSEIRNICSSTAQYITHRPNDKNYRILGDCNKNKSIKNRLINDV